MVISVTSFAVLYFIITSSIFGTCISREQCFDWMKMVWGLCVHCREIQR